MSARILVVDDILPNVKLLEAKLRREYFEVITAQSGPEAIEKTRTMAPDIILLDVMMPEMDGFEVCRILKEDENTAHIPVVMVTALSDPTDRVKGLEAGADDFLSKPVNDLALFSRVKSLARLKMTIDEWRSRESTTMDLGLERANLMLEDYKNANILIINDVDFETEKLQETLQTDHDQMTVCASGFDAIEKTKDTMFDLIVVNLNLRKEDGLRLCSYFRSSEATRSVPILMIAEEQDVEKIAQAMEMGVHDYVMRPVDRNELLVRVRSQIRRKRYQEHMRMNFESSVNMAIKDPLTGLFNRRYLTTHMERMLQQNHALGRGVCVLMFDLDHFKKVNDTHGHDVGDQILKIFADRVMDSLRAIDLVARTGGEEFVAVLPDIDMERAMLVAERLRRRIADEPFRVTTESGYLNVTTSMGGLLVKEDPVSMDEALKRVDIALYTAKETGRNRVYFDGHGEVTQQARNA